MGMYLVLMPLLLSEKSKWYNLALVVTGVFVGLLASKAAWIVAGLVWGCLLVMHGKRRSFRVVGNRDGTRWHVPRRVVRRWWAIQ